MGRRLPLVFVPLLLVSVVALAAPASAAPSPSVSVSSAPSTLEPDEVATVRFTLRNTGTDANSWSHFTVSYGGEVDVTDWSAPSGWSTSEYGPGDALGACGSGGVTASYGMIESAGSMPAGAVRTFEIEVRGDDAGEGWIRYRLTLMTEEDWDGPFYRSPATGSTDQQNCPSGRIEIDVRAPVAPTCQKESGATEAVVDSQVFWQVDCAGSDLDALVWSVDGVERDREGVRGMDSASDSFGWTFDASGPHVVEAWVVTTGGASSPRVRWDVQVDDVPTTASQDDASPPAEESGEEPLPEDPFEEDLPPECAARRGPEELAVGDVGTWRVSCEDDIALRALVWRIDGRVVDDEDLEDATESRSFTHTFRDDGFYTVSAVAEDSNDQESVAVTWDVLVRAPHRPDEDVDPPATTTPPPEEIDLVVPDAPPAEPPVVTVSRSTTAVGEAVTITVEPDVPFADADARVFLGSRRVATLALTDDGEGGDARRGDGRWSAEFVPTVAGTYTFDLEMRYQGYARSVQAPGGVLSAVASDPLPDEASPPEVPAAAWVYTTAVLAAVAFARTRR